MAQEDKFNAVPGEINIISALLTNFDGSDSLEMASLIREFNVFESISTPFITANIVIEDALGLTSTFPIVGQEKLDLVFKTPHPAFKKTISLSLRVIAIENFIRQKDRTAAYVLNCVMPQMILDTNTKVRKAYKNMPISQMVKLIAEEFLGIEELKTLEETEGTRTIVIPNMHPTKAIEFLCREAKSGDPKKIASNYKFYQNNDGFHFRTMEDIIGPTSDKYYPDVYFAGSNDIQKLEAQELFGKDTKDDTSQKPEDFRNITYFKFPKLGDYYSTLRYGGVESKMRLLDPTMSSYTEKIYNYKTDFDKFAKTTRITNGSKTITDNSDLYSNKNEARVFFLLTDSTQNNPIIEPDQKEEMLHYKIASEFLHENILLDITIPGDSDKVVGDTIAIDFPEYGATDDIEKKFNRFFSGEYFVLSLRHMSNDQGYSTIMTCSKNAFEKDIEKYKEVN